MKMPLRFMKVGIAAARFADQRADWYEYLADMITDTKGTRTLRDLFATDAARYGTRSPRGVLSAYWAARIEETGSIGSCLAGTLPAREVGMLAALQEQGEDVFADGLRDLAHLVRLNGRLHSILRSTLLVAGLSAAAALSMLFLALPYFLAPQVLGSFPSLDPALYGPSSSLYFGFANSARANNALIWTALLALIVLFIVSFPKFDGRLRAWLDTWGPYRLYRDIQAIRVVSAAATAVKPRSGKTVPLSHALASQSVGAPRWLNNRLQAMLTKLDEASAGANIFDVGLLDQQTYWYLEDMTLSGGLDIALQKTRVRLETRMLARVQSRATALRWVLLIMAVATTLGLYLCQYAVIFELRDAVVLTNSM